MPLFPNKEPSPDFSNPAIQRAFIDEAKSSRELLQKEYDVNLAEQVLLGKRISMMRDFVNDLPSSDPQYSMLIASLQFDQIELDELRIRAAALREHLSS